MKKISVLGICVVIVECSLFLQASDNHHPHNFSMLPRRPLGGMACPTKPKHIQYLQKKGVRLIISLTQEPLSPDLFNNCPLIRNVHIPIANHCAPTYEDAAIFLKEIEPEIKKGNPVVVHCKHGKGRTGTMLATWLIHNELMDPEEAIKITNRPLHKKQEKFLYTFYEQVTR